MTIYGKLIDENYSRILIEKEDLSLTYVIALDKIQKKERISQEVAKKLRPFRPAYGKAEKGQGSQSYTRNGQRGPPS